MIVVVVTVGGQPYYIRINRYSGLVLRTEGLEQFAHSNTKDMKEMDAKRQLAGVVVHAFNPSILWGRYFL